MLAKSDSCLFIEGFKNYSRLKEMSETNHVKSFLPWIHHEVLD